jgi:hypothetical protein
MILETSQISYTTEEHCKVEVPSLFESAFDTTPPELQTVSVSRIKAHNTEPSNKGKRQKIQDGVSN